MAKRKKRLQKQPKLRRIEITTNAALPDVVLPATAKKRRYRNRRSIKVSTGILKNVVTSSRWISAGLLAVSIWAIWIVGRDDSFFLNTIPVEGAETIPASEIVAGSGLAGSHIFAADPIEAANRIGNIPGVISATVTLEWPNRVTVRIVEESPVALWEQAGQKFWVTEQGGLIPARVDLPDLLLIESEVSEAVHEASFVPKDVLEGALQLQEMRPNIDRLFYRPGNGLSYQDGRGWRAYFGGGLDMAQKLVVYETIVDDLLGRLVTPAYISVKNQTRPYYMLASE